jgi:DNA topoisomerase-1
MKLVIVESPTKAKTISRFLKNDFRVRSSYGHVRDLPSKELGVDVEKNFKPAYVIIPKAEKHVLELKKDAKKADQIILATDEDREGEAIAWHLATILQEKPTKSKDKNKNAIPDATKPGSRLERIVFHEITKSAIEQALKNPRQININLVCAQQARRILDRLVGYKLSPFLWEKVRRGLSAGRVQSVAVRLVCDREKEIKEFKPQEFWTIEAELTKTKKQKNKKTKKQAFIAKLVKQNDELIPKFGIKSKDEAHKILKDLENTKYQVLDIKKKEIKRTPPPPFITSTLQQEAIRKFGFSAKQTMVLAQQLYEGVEIEGKSEGLITYMRTDSFNLSKEVLSLAQKVIGQKFGKGYTLAQPRIYKTKSKSAQEAHEAIRPTNLSRESKDVKNYLDERQFKLYDLIWKRTLACQMKEVVLDSTSVDIKTSQTSILKLADKTQNFYTFRATGSVIKFDGFTKVYTEEGTKNIFREAILPPLEVGEILNLIKINPLQHFTEPPPRFSEASLVAALEKYGIGRPSTYAPILSTIQERGYVEKIERRFHPKEIGVLVNNVLVKHFPQIVNIKFTAEMEKDLDLIAQAKKKWIKILSAFYKPFEENLLRKGKELSKKDLIEEKTEKKCPKCGKYLVIKLGRFGKFSSCSDFPKCNYTEPLEGEKIKEELTSEKCGKCGALMKIKVGRFGKFLACSKYPECKFTKPIITSTGIKCPKCGQGEIVEKRTKKGRIFYACTRYPKCDFAMWQKPTKEKCPECKSLLTYARKNKIKCSNKECKFEKEIEKK